MKRQNNLPYRVGKAEFASLALAEAYADFVFDDTGKRPTIRQFHHGRWRYTHRVYASLPLLVEMRP